MRCLLSLLFVIATAGPAFGEEAKVELERHFRVLQKPRHPQYENGKPWLDARKYLLDRMRHYGLRTIEEQHFNTTVKGDTVQGVNIIGLAEGTNSSGPVIVVGADYSTSLRGNPLKDNTGGLACFLETIHTFFDRIYWYPFSQNSTVIFVAFDLNTREFSGEGMGKTGSNIFVHEWLLPYLDGRLAGKLKDREFRGAVILDSVTTSNRQNSTQILRQGFDKAFPNATAEIRKRNFKGDFLGFLYTSRDKNNAIKDTFFRQYNKDRKLTPYRLQDMELHLNFSSVGDDVLELFNHQSHYPFWTNIEERELPAFLLFDTDNDRTDPTPEACILQNCDVDAFLTKERVAFMTKTTNVLLATLLELQADNFELNDSSAGDLLPTILMTAIASFLATLLK